VTKESEMALRVKEERLRLAMTASSLGTWEMDLVHNWRKWSNETRALHGLKPTDNPDEHIDLTDSIMHPEDSKRLAQLHEELRRGENNYLFEYRTTLTSGEERWIAARGRVMERAPEGPTRIIGVAGDVTERKQHEFMRDFNDAQYKLLADSLPQLVWISNPVGHVTYYNNRRQRYHVNETSVSNALDWQSLMHGDDLEKTERAWQQATQTGTEYEMEHRLRMADGKYAWHLSRATPVRDPAGAIVAWFGTATDIDRLKQADKSAHAGVERLRVATDAALMFAWEMNFTTNELEWAENAANVIGCTPEDLRPDLSDGNFFMHPDDRERVSNEYKQFIESGTDRFEMEFRGLPHAYGRLHWRTAGKFIRDRDGFPDRAVGVTQNITHHVESAAQTKLLDERLKATEEAAGALVYDYDVTARKVWRSRNIKLLLGWDAEEVSDDPESWDRLIHPDDKQHLATQKPTEHLDANNQYLMEYRIRHKDGRYRWMLDTGRAYRNETGDIIRQAGTTVDVTERKVAVMAQQRMASLIELSFEPNLVWKPDGGILEWNQGAERLYGFTREEALGKHPQNLLQTQFEDVRENIMGQLHRSQNWSGEVLNTARDGTEIVVECRYQLIVIDGESVVLEINRDIRERKRAEQNTARMAAVAEATHDAIYGVDLDGIIDTWNLGAERLLGYAEREVVGQHVSLLAQLAQHEEQLAFLKRVAAGETVKPFDTIRKTKQGKLIDVTMAMSPVKAPDGSVVAAAVALHDIGERKEWDVRQRLMNRELAHRVKNSYAVLQAILRSTLKSSPDPQQFANAFSGRLHSMATAHDVLTDNDWRGAELGALIRQQLSQYVSGQRVNLKGGIANLPAEQAAPLSLIINELATNALKHGALSTPQGSININWDIALTHKHADHFVLRWQEKDGPQVTSQGPRGFGSTLIEKSLPEADVKMNYLADGLMCEITWPVKPQACD
jgi:PAS domain S-box-containing protein